MTTYLLTRPEHDTTTHYLSAYSKETIVTAEKKGFKVIDLNREKANITEFEARIKKFSPDLIVLNGHGSDSMVTSHKNEPLLVAGKNEHLLKSKIVYAISCRSAKILGELSVKAGATSYSGYDADFIFVYEPNKFTKPLLDETAKLFLEPSEGFVDSLIKGNSVKDSFKRSGEMIKKNMHKSISANEKDLSTAKYLWWNLKHFVSLGDSSARIII